MLAGPTVRRLHREREVSRQGALREERRRSWRVRLGQTGPRPAVEDRAPDRFPAQPPAAADPFERLLGMARLLGTKGDVLVVDGEVIHIDSRPARHAETWIELGCMRRPIRSAGLLEQRLHSLLHAGERTPAGPSVGGPARASVAAFVRQQLIPSLREPDGNGMPVADLAKPDEGTDLAGPIALEVEPAFAFVGPYWHRLVPFFGLPPSARLHIRRGQRQYIGVYRQPREQALARYDEIVLQAVRSAPPAPGGFRTLYQGSRHAVRINPDGQYALCQQVPPFVVEGPDRQLFYFGAVEIGVWITSPDPFRAIGAGQVQVMHPYRHMFVMGTKAGATICMHPPDGFYRELQAMPLAQGLPGLLEGARMTLCSGFFSRNPEAVFYSGWPLSDAPISAAEARQRRLPVYRFYRTGHAPEGKE